MRYALVILLAVSVCLWLLKSMAGTAADFIDALIGIIAILVLFPIVLGIVFFILSLASSPPLRKLYAAVQNRTDMSMFNIEAIKLARTLKSGKSPDAPDGNIKY